MTVSVQADLLDDVSAGFPITAEFDLRDFRRLVRPHRWVLARTS